MILTSRPAPALPLSQLTVRTVWRSRLGRDHKIAFILAGGVRIPCTIGRSGASNFKREGDGATPRGNYAILTGYFRPDRLRRPKTAIPLRDIRQNDGWCDDPHSGAYNRPVKLPLPKSCEKMWREDRLYDVALVLDYNFRSRAKRRGSAIFFHQWRNDSSPTEGCVAIAPHEMRKLLPRLSRGAKLNIIL